MLEIVVYGLATWRISHMLMYERGPFDMFVKIRRRVAGIQHDDEGFPVGYPDGYFAKLFGCMYCMSMNVSVVIFFFVYFAKILAFLFCSAMVASAIAIFIEEKLSGKSHHSN